MEDEHLIGQMRDARSDDPDARAKAEHAARAMVARGPIDAEEVNKHIPQFEVGEVVELAEQRMEVWTMTPAGMVLDGVRRQAAFWLNRKFQIKSYYFRVIACAGTRVSLVPHGRTKLGVQVRRNPDGTRTAYENVKEKRKWPSKRSTDCSPACSGG